MCNDINSIPSLSATWSEEKKYIKDTRVYAHNSLNKRWGHENYTSGFYLKQDLVYLAENNISTGLFATYSPHPHHLKNQLLTFCLGILDCYFFLPP